MTSLIIYYLFTPFFISLRTVRAQSFYLILISMSQPIFMCLVLCLGLMMLLPLFFSFAFAFRVSLCDNALCLIFLHVCLRVYLYALCLCLFRILCICACTYACLHTFCTSKRVATPASSGRWENGGGTFLHLRRRVSRVPAHWRSHTHTLTHTHTHTHTNCKTLL